MSLYICEKNSRFICKARFFITFVFLLLATSLTQVARSAENLPPEFVVETLVSSLAAPVNLVSLPDGRIFVLEKAGKVKLFDPASNAATTKTVLAITGVESDRERGLASIALDPGFSRNGYFYLYYTQLRNGNRNRISRFTFDPATESAGGEVLVWEDNEPRESCCHFGGGLDFGPDGMLYLTTGEEFDGPQAQDLTRAGGKIIRLNTSKIDASGPWVRGARNLHIIPTDNPAAIMDGDGPNLDEIWAYGLRNPYRAHWDLVNNRFYIGEVGGNVQGTATEDLHIGRAGANFGWPNCEGSCGIAAYDDPIYFYTHTEETPLGGAITAGVVYRGDAFPSEYNEAFFFTDYSLGWIRYLTFDANGDVASVNTFAEKAGTLVAIEQGADDALYAVDYTGKLIKISYDSGNQRPVITSATASRQSGVAPLGILFNASAYDVEGEALSYRWYMGDGVQLSRKDTFYLYRKEGVYNAYVEVSDSEGTRTSDLIPIQVGTPPVATITTPFDGQRFIAGDTIEFSGSNSDTAGAGPLIYEWKINFFHNEHVHPVLNTDLVSGDLYVETSGHDYHDNTGYEFNLTVTDANGLSDTATVRTYPRKVDMRLATIPAGLPITVDGLPLETPSSGVLSYDTVVNFDHEVSVAPSFCNAGNNYVFESWSNGGQISQSVNVPNFDFGLTARFSVAGSCNDLIPQSGLVAQYEAGSGIAGGSGNAPVKGWQDQSDQRNDLVATGDPTLLLGELNGQSVIDLDGAGDWLVRSSNLSEFPQGSEDRSVYAVVNYRGYGWGGVSWGASEVSQTFGIGVSPNRGTRRGSLAVQGWGVDFDNQSTEVGVGAGWLVHSAILDSNRLTHKRNGVQIDAFSENYNTSLAEFVIGREIGKTTGVDMQVAAVLVYDRALGVIEQTVVQNYLQNKYFDSGMGNVNSVPLAMADTATVGNAGSVLIGVLNNDQDDTGLAVNSVNVVKPSQSGSQTVNTDGSITYTHNGGAGTRDTFTYTVEDIDGVTSNEGTVSISITDGVTPGGPTDSLPTRGLVAQFESRAGVTKDSSGKMLTWSDQSGQGNTLRSVGDPMLIPDMVNGQPVIDFDGMGDAMVRQAILNNFSFANTDRTVYLVASYEGVGSGGFGYGSSSRNNTFGLSVSSTGNLRINAYGPNDKVSTFIGTNAGWLVQSARLEAGQLTHSINGRQIDQAVKTYATTGNKLVLGADLDQSPAVDMQVAALLVYDRALTTAEQASVQRYLQKLYFNGR